MSDCLRRWVDQVRRELERLEQAYADSARAGWDGDTWHWQPSRPDACPVTVFAGDPWTLTVAFGRRHSRVELGFHDRADSRERVDELVDLCRALAAGRVAEELSGRASRWRIVLETGEVVRGSTDWWPWTRGRERLVYAPYG